MRWKLRLLLNKVMGNSLCSLNNGFWLFVLFEKIGFFLFWVHADPSPVQENDVLEPTTEMAEEVNEEVYNPSENGEASIEEEEAPVAEVVDEIQDDQMVTVSDSKILEVPKKSYASIVSGYHISLSLQTVLKLQTSCRDVGIYW